MDAIRLVYFFRARKLVLSVTYCSPIAFSRTKSVPPHMYVKVSQIVGI
jgi:hypothetical protein